MSQEKNQSDLLSLSFEELVANVEGNTRASLGFVVFGSSVILYRAAELQKQATEQAAMSAVSISKSLGYVTWALVFFTAILAFATIAEIVFK